MIESWNFQQLKKSLVKPHKISTCSAHSDWVLLFSEIYSLIASLQILKMGSTRWILLIVAACLVLPQAESAGKKTFSWKKFQNHCFYVL